MTRSGSLSTVCRCASILVMLVLVACTPDAATSEPLPQATEPPVPTTGTEPAPFLLSERGLYHVGTHKLSFTDASRDGRYVGITVWYPSVQPADSTSSRPTSDANPDVSGAPYPLILSSTKVANLFAPYLVSHGFVWASVDGIDSYARMNEEVFNQPLDILFTLDQIASSPPEDLDGMIDTEQVGVTGYSFDGYNALALSGARIDPEYYLAQCPNPDATTEPLTLSVLSAFDCGPASEWEAFTANAGEAITSSEDGLWQPMTDERIRAVMPMSGEGWWLFGERGLAAVDRPVLILAGTQDELYPENVQIYEHLGTPDRDMISFIGDGHMVMISSPTHITRIAHFATAFFGYHLQGRDDYSEYFSEAFVTQYDDLAWGVYTE
jgi:predicted dienelactone hydrolase